MSAFLREIEFWGLVVFLCLAGAFVLLFAMHRTGGRAARLLDKALPHKDEQKRHSGEVK